MNAALPLLYTNEVSPEFLRTLDKAPFTEQQLAGFNEEVLATVNKNQVYAKKLIPRSKFTEWLP